MDLNLPKMNGFEFLEALKADAALKGIPVVMITTSEDRQDIARGFALGAVAYVVKCPDYEEFREGMRVVTDCMTEARLAGGLKMRGARRCCP